MKIIFFGCNIVGLKCLQKIIEHGHTVCSVTTEDYYMDEISSDHFADICKKNEIDFYQNDNIENDNWKEKYLEYEADLGVCVNWRRIIREKILSTTRHGFIGQHGYLP